jgi:hypothetical protein
MTKQGKASPTECGGDTLPCFQYYFPFEGDNVILAAVPGDHSEVLFQQCHEVKKMRLKITLKKLL